MPNINALLSRAIIGYRIGKSKPITMTGSATGDSYIVASQKEIKERLPEDEHKIYIKVRDLSRTATNLSRQFLLEDSGHCFNQAWEYLKANAKSEELMLMGKSRIAQGEAFLPFLKRDFKRVRDLLDISLESDEILERDYNYPIFHIQRIHQLHLLIRADIETGQFVSAVELCEKIIRYLTGNLDSLPVGGGWSKEQVEEMPPVFRNSMLSRIAGELAILLANRSFEEGKKLFPNFPGWKLFDDHDFLREIYEWGQTKEAFYNGDQKKFLEKCAQFLEAGRRETLLWYTTVLDLCSLCKTLRPSETESFRKEVTDDVDEMRLVPAFQFPNSLRKMLKNINGFSKNKTDKPIKEFSRLFRAYNVGLPRTGTSSMMALFGKYRSVTEFKEQETIEHITSWKNRHISSEVLKKYVLIRDRDGGLEMDAASFNHFYLDILIEEFPDAKFVFTVRDCYTWVNSFLKMMIRWRKRFHDTGMETPQWMGDYGRILFEGFTWNGFSSQEEIKPHLPELVEKFIRCWAENNSNVLAILPPERSLIIRTDELSNRLDDIADFIGIPRDRLTSADHINKSPDSVDLLKDIDRNKFDALCMKHGGDVMERVFSKK